MTVRMAHPSHRWNYQTAECRLCGCSSATIEAQGPCLKAPLTEIVKKSPRPRAVPDLHAAALQGAKDLVRK